MFKRSKNKHIGGATTKTSNTRTGTSYSLLDKSSNRYSRSVSFKNGVYRTTIVTKNGDDWINRKSRVVNTNKKSSIGVSSKRNNTTNTIKKGITSKNSSRDTTMGEAVIAGYLILVFMMVWIIHQALIFIGVPPETLESFYNKGYETLTDYLK